MLNKPIQIPVFHNDEDFDREDLGLPEINLAESGKAIPTIFFRIDAIEPYENYGTIYINIISGGDQFFTAMEWKDKDSLIMSMGFNDAISFNK